MLTSTSLANSLTENDPNLSEEHYRIPFSWEERKVHLGSDQTLFIPEFYQGYENFQMPSWDHQNVFGNSLPVAIEFCSGNGMWVVDRAKRSLGQWNWVSVEFTHIRAKKIWRRRKEFGASNLFLVIGDARTYAQHYVADCSVDSVYVNFPDPWPKRCHAKHRLMTQTFLQNIQRLLKVGACLTFVTDHPEYAVATIELLKTIGGFELLHAPEYYQTHIPDYGLSFFESLWRSVGKKIHYIQAIKKI